MPSLRDFLDDLDNEIPIAISENNNEDNNIRLSKPVDTGLAGKIAPPTPHKGYKSIPMLEAEAQRAHLEEEISKCNITKYKAEQIKMSIEEKAANLIEYRLAEFLFFGYMEKVNCLLLGIMKRNYARMDNLIKERDHKAIDDLVNREITATIIDIKKQQQKDVNSWRQRT